MNCKNVQVQLSSYLDDELSGRDMLEMRRHLLDCEACREEEEALRVLKAFLEQAPDAEPAPDFEDRLLLSVSKIRHTDEVRQKASIWTLSCVAAASMLITLLVLPTIRSHNADSQASKAVAATQESGISRRQMASYASDPLNGGSLPPYARP